MGIGQLNENTRTKKLHSFIAGDSTLRKTIPANAFAQPSFIQFLEKENFGLFQKDRAYAPVVELIFTKNSETKNLPLEIAEKINSAQQICKRVYVENLPQAFQNLKSIIEKLLLFLNNAETAVKNKCIVLNTIGSCQVYMGKFDDALSSFKQCQELLKECQDDQLYAACLNNQALVYMQMQENEKAKKLLQEAAKTLKTHSLQKELSLIECHLHMLEGSVAFKNHDYASALLSYSKVDEICVVLDVNTIIHMWSSCIRSLHDAACECENGENQIVLLGEIKKISEKMKKFPIQNVIERCFVLGRNSFFFGSLLLRMERHEEANTVLQSGLDHIRKGFSGSKNHTYIHVLILKKMAENFEHLFQYDKAIKYEKDAMKYVHNIIDVSHERQGVIEKNIQLLSNGLFARNKALNYTATGDLVQWIEAMKESITNDGADFCILCYNVRQFSKHWRRLGLECNKLSVFQSVIRKFADDIVDFLTTHDVSKHKTVLWFWYIEMAYFCHWISDYPQCFLYSQKVVEITEDIPEHKIKNKNHQIHAAQLLLQGVMLYFFNNFEGSRQNMDKAALILRKLAIDSFSYQIWIWNCQIAKLISRAREIHLNNGDNFNSILHAILSQPFNSGFLFCYIESLINANEILRNTELSNEVHVILESIASASLSLITRVDCKWDVEELYTMYLQSQRYQALSYMLTGKFDQSITYNKKAVNYAVKWYGSKAHKIDIYSICLNNIGQNFYNLGNYEKAEKWYLKAFDAIQYNEGFDETFESRIEDARGKLCQKNNDLKKAFKHYTKVDEIMKKCPFKNKQIGSLLNFMLSCKHLVFTKQATQEFNRNTVIPKMKELLVSLCKIEEAFYWNKFNDVSWAWGVLGECYSHMGDKDLAGKARKQSVNNFEKFQQALPRMFDLTLSQISIGPLYEDFSTVNDLLSKCDNLWKTNKNESMKYFHQLADLIHDDKDGSDIYAVNVCVGNLFEKANECINSYDENYTDFVKQEIIPLLERILSENPKVNFSHKFFMDLGEYFFKLGNKEKSKQHLTRAKELLSSQEHAMSKIQFESCLNKISTFLTSHDDKLPKKLVQAERVFEYAKQNGNCTSLLYKNKEIKTVDVFTIADKLKNDKCLNSIRFQSCVFTENSLEDLLKKITFAFYERKMKLMEISDTNDLKESHAKALGLFLCSVHVATLDLHGSNLKQFANTVFKRALRQAPKKFETRIVFETDEVTFKADSSGTTKDFGFSGSSIFVPPGALEEETEIRLLVLPEMTKLPDGLIQVTPIVRCLPTGLNFNKPVTISLSTWCHATQKSTELTVFTREDANKENWKEESKVKYNNEKFIQFQTSHFSDDVVAASQDEVLLDYQVLVYRKKYAEFNDDQTISIYCLPDNNDLFNKINNRCQVKGYSSCFPDILLKGKPNQTNISIEITSMNCEIENGFKEFSCADFNGLDSMHTCGIIYDDGSRESKEKGIRLNFKLEVDGEMKKEQSFKVHWKTPPNHNSENLREINNVYNVDMKVQKAKKVEVANISALSGSSNINTSMQTLAITENKDNNLPAIEPNSNDITGTG